MTYSIDKMATWTNLADYLINPVNFPVGITTNFLVAFSRAPRAYEGNITFHGRLENLWCSLWRFRECVGMESLRVMMGW